MYTIRQYSATQLTETSMNNNKIQSIQVLRGIAAMLVVLFHFRTEINKTFPGIGDALFINGSMGVDIFFLISGFIVFYVANDANSGINSSIEFLIKRLCRIIPPYYLITLCVAGSSIDSWYETIRSMLFIPLGGDSQGPVYGYARLNVGWTLNYEFLFYILSTIAILFKRFKWIVLGALILSLTLLPALFFGWNNFDPRIGYNFSNVYLRLMTNPLITEFFVGIIIGWLYTKDLRLNNHLFWFLLLASSILFFFYIFFTGALWGNSPKAFMVPSAFVLFTITQYEKRFKINWWQWPLNLGAISFSIYLIHVQMLSFIKKIAGKVDLIFPDAIIALIAVIATLFFAKISYNYIETKLSMMIRNWFLKKLNINIKR